MSYTLITINDVADALGVFIGTVGDLKSQILHSAIVEVGEFTKSVVEGNIIAIVGVIGSLLLLWRLKGWFPGFIKNILTD